MSTVSVIIPTLNGARPLSRLLPALARQSVTPEEVLVIDSSSSDGTLEVARAASCRTLRVALEEFDHGGTRNLGARAARGEILVFMTQDALPADVHFLENLTGCLGTRVAASYARQLPYPEATPVECFARLHSYPPVPHVRDARAASMAGIRGFFFSDVASAVRRAAFEAVGGFPNRVPTNEDMLLCARLLAGGWSVRYAAEAQVYHSHNFSCADLARRYYRIGVFLALHGSSLASGSVSGEGLRFMWEQLRYLSGTGAWCWIPRSVVDCAVKYAGFRLGFRSGLREAAMAAQSSPGVRP